MHRERGLFTLFFPTRRSQRWPVALALLLAATPLALTSTAGAQTPAMVPDLPPAPPAAPAPLLTSAPRPATVAPPGVAATVNGVKIYRFQVANEALKMMGPQLVNQMILIELIKQTALKEGVSVSNAQVDARLAQLRQQYAERVPGGLEAILAQRHQTLRSYKDQLKTEILVEALVAKTVPPTAASAATPRFHARHLLILTSSPNPQMAPDSKPPHTDAEALALIAKAQVELKAGKSFIDVANAYTEDPSGKGKGGDLGLLDAKTQFDPAFLKAALALKPGEVTAVPVKSVYGYHLIKLDSSNTAPLPSDAKLYAAAAEADRRQLVQQAIPAYVQKLKANAKIVDYLAAP